jgi:hypothetical protein
VDERFGYDVDVSSRIDTGSRIGNAGVAAGIGLAAVAAPTIAVATMFSGARYGESFAKTVGRNSWPIVAGFGLPMAAGAAASAMVGGSKTAGVFTGMGTGALAGAALGATIMHPVMTAGMSSGSSPSRLLSAGLFLGAGALMGTFGALLSNAAVER